MAKPLHLKGQNPTNNFESGLDLLNDDPDDNLTDEEREELSQYFEQDGISEPEEDEDEDDKEEESSVEFDGFDTEDVEKPSKPTTPKDDPLIQEMQTMTPEKFQELIKSDPAKAMEMTVTAVLQKRGITNFDPRDVMKATQTYVSVQETRKSIAQQFNPAKNPKLKERALKIYKERGFDVRTNPMAEFDAFVIAAHQDPSLLADQDTAVRNEPPSNLNSRRRRNIPDTRLSSEDVRIAERMGVSLKDPKTVKRLVALKADYNRRRRA